MRVESTIAGFLTVSFGGLAALHFLAKFLRRRKSTSLALAAVCLSTVLSVLPLQERIERRHLWLFRDLQAAVVVLLWWSIRRVDVVEDALEQRAEKRRELHLWREQNPGWSSKQAPPSGG